jgi:thioredoxin 1
MALSVTSQTFDKEVKQSSIPVVVDMYASWCGPCKMIAPLFEEMAKELATTHKLVKVNIDEERDLAIQYNVSSIPTFLFIKNGQLIAKESGYMNKETLKAKISGHLG